MKLIRPLVFWSHLVAGVVAGVVIAVMSFTGAAIAFEKEIIGWAERDVRCVTPLAEAARLSLDELLARVKNAQPEFKLTGVTVFNDPGRAVLLSAGRTNSVHANPYSGELRPQGAAGVRAFMYTMTDWHRWLGREGAGRAVGKAITGACNFAFLVLAVSGLYLWWPRQWSRTALWGITLFNFKLGGKARDWNWHNVCGLWMAPVLIVLTLTALPISYQWAGNLIYRLTGSEPPPPGGGAPAGRGGDASSPEGVRGALAARSVTGRPLGYESLLAVVVPNVPDWAEITLRTGGGGRGGGRGEAGVGAARAEAAPRIGTQSDAAEAPRSRNSDEVPPRGPQPVTASIKERGQWPLFATTQLTLDPVTGAVLKREAFGDASLGRQVRSWTRFLHTGEALGLPGKALAGLASLLSLVLVWTGFGLTWRRFFVRKRQSAQVG